MRQPPLVAIVGRPNVGKSRVFNRFCGFRKALVHDRPGLTRDRNYGSARWDDRRFNVVDTGGLLGVDEGRILDKGIGEQAFAAIDEAVLVLFVVDARAGLTPLDHELGTVLRQRRKQVVLVVNKVDGPNQEDGAAEFHQLGFQPVVFTSAEHGLGFNDLHEAIFSFIADLCPADTESEENIQLAIVGRPNAGKSTLVNRILGEDRVLVSSIPGTTRDSVDVTLSFRGRVVTLVDTAGIRKKARVSGAEEKLSVSMAIKQIERSAVAVLLLDATAGIGAQDAAIAGHVARSGRGVIVAVNKWDLIDDRSHQGALELVRRMKMRLRFLDYAPVILISALDGTRVVKMLDQALAIEERWRTRVSTPKLNNLLEAWVGEKPPPRHSGRPVKIYYGTQVSSRPPVFKLFVNTGAKLYFSYERFLVNRIREAFDFEGVPIRLVTAERKQRRAR
jgi:GTP-binding protein